ncbi:hypothetical protein BJ165DRAFT_1596581 [Panaeolus papilionaceus]|nr:hypothetical protein BJ165DRAFT_1596581 [Panaeolus papilionaceus]
MALPEWLFRPNVKVGPGTYGRFAILYSVAKEETQNHAETAVEQFLKARGYTHNGWWEKEATLEDVRADIRELRNIEPAGATLKEVQIMYTPQQMCHFFLPEDDV